MSRRYTALESILHDAGLSRRRVQAIVWSLRAGGDTVPNEDTIAGLLLRWRDAHARELLTRVGYDHEPREQGPFPPAEVREFPDHPELPFPPQLS